MASSSNVPHANAPNSPRTSPELDDEAQLAGQGRIKHTEVRLENVHKGVKTLIRRLEESEKKRGQALTIRQKRHKREQKLTAEAIRREKRRSDIGTIVRAGQGRRIVNGMYSRATSLHEEFNPLQAAQDFAPFLPYLPPELLEEIEVPAFTYTLSHMFMPEEAHTSIANWIPDHDARNREYQELMHTYLYLSTARMADISPCYMDIWRSYIPSLAVGPNGFLPLLGAMCALAALHMTSSQVDGYEARAMVHYHTAVSNLRLEKNLFAIDDAVLATILILAHYELWNGQITKMGSHMKGALHIIVHRGKEASKTPLGRALFAFFLRTDCGSSVVTGNPVYLDESWWKNDPLSDTVIPLDAPILLAADIAMTKLCVIIAKLTLLKTAARKRRERLIAKIQNGEYDNPEEKEKKTEERIRQQVLQMHRELDAWHRNLPPWFGAVHSDQMEDGEEDINQTAIIEPQAERYPHFSIAVVLAWAFGVHIQLWRVANPDELDPPPRIGALVHAIFRAYLATPSSSDSMTIGNIWIAACLLRQKHHRDWLEIQIRRRIRDTNFYGWKFAYHGILHSWADSDGKQLGRFKSMPVGAQELVPGVSENLWRADGIMNTSSSNITLDDEVVLPEGRKPMYRFEGDAKLFDAVDSDDEEENGPTMEPESDNSKKIPLSFIDDY